MKDYIQQSFDIHNDDYDIDAPNFDASKNTHYGIPYDNLTKDLQQTLQKFIQFRTDPFSIERKAYLPKVGITTAKKDVLNLQKLLGWYKITTPENIIPLIRNAKNISELCSEKMLREFVIWLTTTRGNKFTTAANIMNSMHSVVTWLVKACGLLSDEHISTIKGFRDECLSQARAVASQRIEEIAHPCLWDGHIQEARSKAFELAQSSNNIDILRNAVLIGFMSSYPTDRVSIIRQLTKDKTLVNVQQWIPKGVIRHNVTDCNKEISECLDNLKSENCWHCGVLFIQLMEHTRIVIRQNSTIIDNPRNINQNQDVSLFLEYHKYEYFLQTCSCKDFFNMVKWGYWMIDCTDPRVPQAAHKTTRCYGFKIKYPCENDHSDIIDKYIRINENNIKQANGYIFHSVNYNPIDCGQWSKMVKDVYSQFIPKEICPNPKEFRNIYINHLRNNVDENSQKNRQILQGSCLIQKHSLKTQESVYDQNKRNRDIYCALEFTFGVVQNHHNKPPEIQNKEIENEDPIEEIENEDPIEENHDSGEEEYIVEKIVDKRTKNKKIEYLIKWENWDNKDNTWEPVEHLQAPEVQEMIQKWENKKKRKRN